jgi:hypothetical protein
VHAITALYLIRPVRHVDPLTSQFWVAGAMFPIRHWLRIIAGVGRDSARTLDGNYEQKHRR